MFEVLYNYGSKGERVSRHGFQFGSFFKFELNSVSVNKKERLLELRAQTRDSFAYTSGFDTSAVQTRRAEYADFYDIKEMLREQRTYVRRPEVVVKLGSFVFQRVINY